MVVGIPILLAGTSQLMEGVALLAAITESSSSCRSFRHAEVISGVGEFIEDDEGGRRDWNEWFCCNACGKKAITIYLFLRPDQH